MKHGTRGGYIHHRYLKQRACDACTAANAEWVKVYRHRTGRSTEYRPDYRRKEGTR